MARNESLGGRGVCRDAESADAAGACVEAASAENAACASFPFNHALVLVTSNGKYYDPSYEDCETHTSTEAYVNANVGEFKFPASLLPCREIPPQRIRGALLLMANRWQEVSIYAPECSGVLMFIKPQRFSSSLLSSVKCVARGYVSMICLLVTCVALLGSLPAQKPSSKEVINEYGLLPIPYMSPPSIMTSQTYANHSIGLVGRGDRVEFTGDASGAVELVGSWRTGSQSAPADVSAREFAGGNVIAVARVANGLSSNLAVAWLKWSLDPTTGKWVLVVQRERQFGSLSFSANREPPVKVSRVVNHHHFFGVVEIASWDLNSQLVGLVLNFPSISGAVFAEVNFESTHYSRQPVYDPSQPASGMHRRPNWSKPERLEASWIAAGANARATEVKGSRYACILSGRGPDGSLLDSPIHVFKQGRNGSWSELTISGSQLVVEPGYMVWANSYGELCVSTPRTLTKAGGGLEQACKSFRLTLNQASVGKWHALQDSGWRGKIDRKRRMLIEHEGTGKPFVLFPKQGGNYQRVATAR